LVTHFPDEASPHLESALMDRSAAIRDFARFEIRKRGEVDFARMYRKAMAGASTVRLAAAIAGLGEAGEPSDAEAILPFLEHPSARVRLASVRSVVHLGGERFVPNVLPSLSDPATSVASLAVKMLSRYAAVIGGAELQTRFQESAEQHSRINVLRMIAALPKWESIRMLLDAATDRDAAVASVGREYVLPWMARYNRSSIPPSKEQVKLVRAAVANAVSAIEPELIREIRFTVDSWPRT
jgi:HEAT repeat protein